MKNNKKIMTLEEQLDELKRNKKNIFLYGMSGSGKDTSADYIRDTYGYIKLRLADTIKRIICEKEGLTYDELEELKRTNPEFRRMHNTVGDMLDATGYCVNVDGDVISVRRPTGTINRINQIINKTAFDFQHFTKEQISNLNIVVCDCRTKEWCEIFLQNGWTGIFLTRTTEEFGLKNHATEQNMFLNGEINDLLKVYSEQMILICNDVVKEDEFYYNIYEIEQKVNWINTVESSKEALLQTIDTVMEITGVDKKRFDLNNIPVKLQPGICFGTKIDSSKYEATLKKLEKEFGFDNSPFNNDNTSAFKNTKQIRELLQEQDKTPLITEGKFESEPGLFTPTPFFEPTTKQEFEIKFREFDINPNKKYIPEVSEFSYEEAAELLKDIKGNDKLLTDVLILKKYLFGWKFILNLSEDGTQIETLKFIYNVEQNPAWTFLTLEYSEEFNLWQLKSTFSEINIFIFNEGCVDNSEINKMLDVCETIGLKNRLKQFVRNGMYIGFDVLTDIELMKPLLLEAGFKFDWDYINGKQDVPHFYKKLDDSIMGTHILYFNEESSLWHLGSPFNPTAIVFAMKMDVDTAKIVCEQTIKRAEEYIIYYREFALYNFEYLI